MLRFLTFLGVVFALGLAAISVSANFWFGTLLTVGPERWLYGVVFALLDGLKTVLVPLAAAALAAGLRAKATAAIATFAILTALSFTAEIGLYAHTKSEVVGDAKAARARYADAKAGRDSANAAVAAMGSVRAAGDIEADIGTLKRDRLYDRSKQCVDATVAESRDLCARLDRLAGEKTKAAELARLKQEAAEATVKLEKLDVAAAMRSIDPQAEALAKLLSVAVIVEPETVRTGLAVLIALLIELGSGLGPWLASPSQRKDEAAEEVQSTAEVLDPLEAAEPREAPVQADAEASDLVARWAAEALVRRRGSFVPAAEVRAAFEAFCEGEGREPLNPTAFGKALTAAGYVRAKVGGRIRYEGVALTATAVRAPTLRVAVDNTPRRALGHMAGRVA